MARFQDQVTDEFLRPIPGCDVWVFIATAGNPQAVLTGDLGEALTQPLHTDDDGIFYYNTADGDYENHVHYGGELRYVQEVHLGPAVSGPPGGNVMAVGLFVALATLSVPLGTTIVQTSGYDTQGRGHALYIEDTSLNDAAVAAHPRGRVKTANGRFFRLSHEQLLNPYHFGAVGDDDGRVGPTNDGPAFVAAMGYLATIMTAAGPGNFYAGSPALNIVGNFWLNNTTLEPTHGTQWMGAGSGRYGPSGGAGTQMRWADGCHGVIVQFPNTSGPDTIDGATHTGCPGFTGRGIKFKGGYAGVQANEGLWHGMVCRSITELSDCYFYGWSGYGQRGWAGGLYGAPGSLYPSGNVGGNFSESTLYGVKFENCYIGHSCRGSDANVVRRIGCTYYLNRLRGMEDENGAGSNIEIGAHAAGNGLITNPYFWTQCSAGGYRYALAVGGNKANAPSGGPSSTADWRFIEAGGAIVDYIPAYNAALDFRVGGDYLTLTSAGVHILNCYSEYGGFSHFNQFTPIMDGTIGAAYYYGGNRVNWHGDGFHYRTNSNFNAAFYLDNDTPGTEAQIWATRFNVSYGLIDFVYNAFNLYRSHASSGHIFQYGSGTEVGRLDSTGFQIPAGAAFYVNSIKVVGARQAAVTSPTGGTTIDTQARTAIDAIRAALTAHGLTA